MVVKQVAAKKGTGSFRGLAAYLLDEQNKQNRIHDYNLENVPYKDLQENLQYIRDMQNLNQSVKGDKTLHLVVSFREDEQPTPEVLKAIEEELLKSIGMETHHRLSVVHNDTNNFHFHIAVNKLHPETNNIIEPFKSKIKLQKKASELEEKYKLKVDNHTPNWQLEKDQQEKIERPTPVQNSKIKDNEIHSGMDSLLTWIKEEALEEIQNTLKDPESILDDLHKTLADYNLEIKLRANGIVIGDKTRNLFVKASDVHRNLSLGKLNKRYGEFHTSSLDIEPIKKFGKQVNKYWERYQEISKEKKGIKIEELALEKEARLTLKEAIKNKYAARIENIQSDPFILKRDKHYARKEIYAQRRKEYEVISETFAKKRNEIFSRTKQISYKEYLMEEALKGDTGALDQLRKTKIKPREDENALLHPDGKGEDKTLDLEISRVTKQGNAIYEIEEGTIIDKGNHLKVSIDRGDKGILTALKMSQKKYGDDLDIQGSLEFKTGVLMVSERYDLGITFRDKVMKEIGQIVEHQKRRVTMKEQKASAHQLEKNPQQRKSKGRRI